MDEEETGWKKREEKKREIKSIDILF